MKRCISILLICCIPFMTGCNGNPFKAVSAVSCYQDGMEAYDKGEYKEAVEQFREVVKKDETGQLTVYSYSFLGHCMMKTGDSENALKYYETALSTGKEAAMCYTNLGVYYRKCENYAMAEQCYKNALDVDAGYADAMNGLGVVYGVTEREADAVRILEQAVGSAEEHPAVYDANLAYAYASVGRIDDAEDRLLVAKAKGYETEGYAAVHAYIEECKTNEEPVYEPEY